MSGQWWRSSMCVVWTRRTVSGLLRKNCHFVSFPLSPSFSIKSFSMTIIVCFLHQHYEARLFRLNKVHGGIITSAEEAVDLQKKNSALNRFYWNLSQRNKTSNSSADGYEESRKRDVREKVVVSYLVNTLFMLPLLCAQYRMHSMWK